MQHFVGLGNFFFLFHRPTFWAVVSSNPASFAVTAVIFQAVVGFVVAHFVHNILAKGPAASGAACCWCHG